MNSKKSKLISFVSIILVSFAFQLAAGDGKKVKYSFESGLDEDGKPRYWTYKGRPFTNGITYAMKKGEDGKKVLRMISDSASGVIMIDISGVDLNKYPIMRWKWRALSLPSGADARNKDKDDQGIGIYVGHGRISRESVSYTWETETPKGSTGTSEYGLGGTVHWTAMRDKNDLDGQWKTEEVNVKEDVLRRMGLSELPDKMALTISNNSQYTDSTSITEIEFIEFVEKPSGGR